jgi:ABC-2 type transport system permease protein
VQSARGTVQSAVVGGGGHGDPGGAGGGVLRLGRFFAHYVRANFRIALEYRVSFFAQVFAMVLNDAMWVAFWAIFFARFEVVRGYEFRDVVVLWSLAAVSFGLANGLFGNCWKFAAQVASGGLDFYLVLPKPVLLHLLIGGMEWSAWGDVLFGIGAYALLAGPTPGGLALFLLLALFSTAVMVAYAVIMSSLAFWLGNAEALSAQSMSAMTVFATYPGALFSGWVKVALFIVVPAGFVAYVPADLLREWSWPLAGGLVAGTAAFAAAAVLVFYAGLRRYESGNLLAMRG